jgi:hypothetical protein
MKNAFALFVLPFLSGAALQADYVIVQKVDGTLQSGNMTIKIKDAKVRTDVGTEISTLTDGVTGDTITLMHGQKSFMKIPAERSKALVAQLQKLRGGADNTGAPPKLTSTGKKEKVDKYDCEVFTWSAGGMNVTYWITKDFPNFAQINAAMEKTRNEGLTSVGKGVLPSAADLPGYPVKTEMAIGAQKFTTTIVSVNEENVDPGVFEVPANYKEMAVPAFNFPSSAPAK